MLKVYVDAPVGLSRAMTRVSNAMRCGAEGVRIVSDERAADVVFLHVVGFDDTVAAIEKILERGQSYALIQYCLKSTQRPDPNDWLPLWEHAVMVWSYYKLPDGHYNFYHSPLGLDLEFQDAAAMSDRRSGIVTSGYVSTCSSEAIQEVATAASYAGLTVSHIGPPSVVGMSSTPAGWRALHGISDQRLAEVYGQSLWVSGLRFTEGFEMPVIEGLACGARPIVFDRADMRQWYDGHAVFVPECSGDELIDRLAIIFASTPEPVSATERAAVLSRFSWPTIIHGLWETFHA